MPVKLGPRLRHHRHRLLDAYDEVMLAARAAGMEDPLLKGHVRQLIAGCPATGQFVLKVLGRQSQLAG